MAHAPPIGAGATSATNAKGPLSRAFRHGCEVFPGDYCFTASTWTMTLMSFEKPYWIP
jgi:hypothetical protein